MTILISYGKYADEKGNPVANPNTVSLRETVGYHPFDNS